MSSQNLNPLTNGSYWGPPDETPDEVFFEKMWLASGYMTGLGFGMQFILYLACMRILWRPPRSTTSYSLMAYITALCSTNFIYTVTGLLSVQYSFIDYRNFPGGVFIFINESTALPSNIVDVSAFVAGSILADLLLLWRCRIIWCASLGARANWYMVIPMLMALGSFALGIMWDVLSANPGGFFAQNVGQIALAYFSLSLALNIILTGMIMFRIWSYQRVINMHLGKDYGQRYTSISTMFVESAAMYTAIAIPVLVTFTRGAPESQIFLGFAPAVQAMASYFIIWRVAKGRAWTRDTLTGVTSSLVFTNPSHTQVSTKPSNGAKRSQNANDSDIQLNSFKHEQALSFSERVISSEHGGDHFN